jgi:protein-tyrosine phosphatase
MEDGGEENLALICETDEGKLFVGNLKSASDKKTLNISEIKMNINLSGIKIGHDREIFVEGFDDVAFDFPQQRKKIIEIAKHISIALKNGNVLVNCAEGYNRAPTCVAAYLIIYENYCPAVAIKTVRDANEIYRKMWAIENKLFLNILETLSYESSNKQ